MGQMMSGLSQVFEHILSISAMASVMICLILVIRWIFRDKINIRWQYLLWLLVIVRLAVPWTPESPFSLYNVIHLNVESPLARSTDTGQRIQSQTTDLQETVHHVSDQQTVYQPEAGTFVQQPDIVTISNEASPVTGFDIWMLMWLLGVSIMIISIGVGHLAFKRKIYPAVRVTDPHMIRLFEQCKQTMRIRKRIHIKETNGIKSPALYGVIHPKLFMPAASLQSYSEQELKYIFMHELSHDKRKDIAVNWIMAILLCVHWFNPLIWYAYYRLREDQEAACDALTLSYLDPKDSAEYGHTILKQLERHGGFTSSPAATGFAGGKSTLKRRIRLIARFDRASYRWSLLGIGLLILIAAVALTKATDKGPDDPNQTTLVSTLTNGETFQFRGWDWLIPLDEVLAHEGWDREELREVGPAVSAYEKPIFFPEVELTVDATLIYHSENSDMFVGGEYYASFEDEEQYLAAVDRVKQELTSAFNQMKKSGLDDFNPLPQSSDSLMWWAEDGSRLTMSVSVNDGQFEYNSNPPYVIQIDVAGPSRFQIDENTIVESMVRSNRLIDNEYLVSLMFPRHWTVQEGYSDRYGGEDGFLQLSAAKGESIDAVVERELNHHLKPYGDEPEVEPFIIRSSYRARLILPSDDQAVEWQRQAMLIVQYPNPVTIGNTAYDYFIVWADKDHIRDIADSVVFGPFVEEVAQTIDSQSGIEKEDVYWFVDEVRNLAEFNEFTDNVNQRIKDAIRVVTSSKEGVPIYKDLSFDGEYLIVKDSQGAERKYDNILVEHQYSEHYNGEFINYWAVEKREGGEKEMILQVAPGLLPASQ